MAFPRATVAHAPAMASIHSSIGKSLTTSSRSSTTRRFCSSSLIAISLVCRHGAARTHLGTDPLRLAGARIDRTPKRSRTRENAVVVATPNLGESLEAQSIGDAHPSANDDLVAENRWTEIIDLMPERDPCDLRQCTVRREVRPMGRRRVLHPLQVDDVVHVRPLVEL